MGHILDSIEQMSLMQHSFIHIMLPGGLTQEGELAGIRGEGAIIIIHQGVAGELVFLIRGEGMVTPTQGGEVINLDEEVAGRAPERPNVSLVMAMAIFLRLSNRQAWAGKVHQLQ
jgi:hypothetical protein